MRGCGKYFRADFPKIHLNNSTKMQASQEPQKTKTQYISSLGAQKHARN